MVRERALKAVLVVVGLLFTAGVIPLTMFFSREPAVPMIMSIYVTLGIFLLLAVRDPAANRSPIRFAGWANLAHAAAFRVASLDEFRKKLDGLGVKYRDLNGGGKMSVRKDGVHQIYFQDPDGYWVEVNDDRF